MAYPNEVRPSAAMAGGDATKVRPLESLGTAVQRVNTATAEISYFLTRWHGPSPEPVAGSLATQEQQTTHASNLGRLFDALDALEDRVRVLNELG